MTIFNPGSLITASQLQLLEKNFASAVAPSNPVSGQLWYDSSINVLKMFTGSQWIFVSGGPVTLSTIAPTSPEIGALWYNTSSNRLYVWNGSAWISITPLTTITYSETPPSDPYTGSLWYNSTNTVGRMSIWNGSTWIDTNPSGSAQGSGPGGNQNWQNLTSVRSTGVTYTNTTQQSIMVSIQFNQNSYTSVIASGVTLISQGGSNLTNFYSFMVPPSGTYSITGSISIWCEFR